MMHQFKIVVPSFNSVDYIEKTLSSIEQQTYRNYEVCVIDDCSTIARQREIILDFCTRNGWKYRFHKHNYGALYGLIHAIRDFNCVDDDVILVLDGDDWFYDGNALAKLHRVYTETDVQLTWGQCETYPFSKTPLYFAQPIPDMVIDKKLFREITYVFWHPATFKYLLWRHIKDEDLRDTNGEYFRLFKDKATMFPMLEMAGHKIRFIKDVLCVYNLENPLNDYRSSDPQEFKRVDQYIKYKPKYSTLPCNIP